MKVMPTSNPLKIALIVTWLLLLLWRRQLMWPLSVHVPAPVQNFTIPLILLFPRVGPAYVT
jgi:hypothetical protein